MIDLYVRRNFFAGHGTGRDGTGRDSSSKSAAGRDGTKLDLAGHGTGRDGKKIVGGRRDGTGWISDAAGRDGTEKMSSRRSLVCEIYTQAKRTNTSVMYLLF
jgi:hypothetical protein